MLFCLVPPMITIQNQLVGAMLGQSMTLDCHSEAYPKSINYWTRDKADIIAQGLLSTVISGCTKLIFIVIYF